jgi:Holliday junction resolvasome RuvABC endonuclease subunit
MDIELDGRGHSEWVSQTYTTIESKIDEIIKGHQFKVVKIEKQFLPLTVDNMERFKQQHGLD